MENWIEINNKINLKVLVLNKNLIENNIKGFILPLDLIAREDQDSILELVYSFGKKILIDSDSWKLIDQEFVSKIEEKYNESISEEKELSTKVKTFFEALGKNTCLEGIIETILFNENFDIIENWLNYQNNIDVFMRENLGRVHRDITGYLLIGNNKKHIHTELEAFTLPYIPIILENDTENFKNSIDCNIKILENAPSKFKNKLCIPLISTNINSWKNQKIYDLLSLIDSKFKKVWIWFIDFSEFNAKMNDINKLNEVVNSFINFKNLKFYLRYGGIFINRLIPEIFRNCCVKVDGWAQHNFILNYGRRTRHIYHPQYGTFVSEFQLLRNNELFNSFNCSCKACNEIKEKVNLTIPELLKKRSEIRIRQKKGEKIPMGIKTLGLSDSSQTKKIKEHCLIKWIEIQNLSDDLFIEKLENWKGSAPKIWKKFLRRD